MELRIDHRRSRLVFWRSVNRLGVTRTLGTVNHTYGEQPCARGPGAETAFTSRRASNSAGGPTAPRPHPAFAAPPRPIASGGKKAEHRRPLALRKSGTNRKAGRQTSASSL